MKRTFLGICYVHEWLEKNFSHLSEWIRLQNVRKCLESIQDPLFNINVSLVLLLYRPHRKVWSVVWHIFSANMRVFIDNNKKLVNIIRLLKKTIRMPCLDLFCESNYKHKSKFQSHWTVQFVKMVIFLLPYLQYHVVKTYIRWSKTSLYNIIRS